MPAVVDPKHNPLDHFAEVNDEKLQLSLTALADQLNERERARIYAAYNDPELGAIYRSWRASGQFQVSGFKRSTRKVMEIPDPSVWRFLDLTMTALYGPDWLNDERAINHELVKPWWVISKL